MKLTISRLRQLVREEKRRQLKKQKFDEAQLQRVIKEELEAVLNET